MLQSPIRTIVPPWSWKAAALSAVFRAAAFFLSNLRAGRSQATKAMAVEAVFAIFAGGLIGAISQYLRRARPLWATALFVCAGMPAVLVLAQLLVHRLAATPHESSGIVSSFLLTALAAAFSWYAMRHGAILGGVDQTPIRHDVAALPGITRDFLLAAPRALLALRRRQHP